MFTKTSMNLTECNLLEFTVRKLYLMKICYFWNGKVSLALTILHYKR